MRKLIALILLLISGQAFAAEHVGSFGTLTLDTGVTLTGGGSTLSFSNVWAKGVRKTDATILKGHTYDVALTITNYSGTGTIAAYVTGNTGGCAAGTWVNSPNGYHGDFDIADNFNTSAAITSAAADIPPNGVDSREPDPNGSFRFSFNMAKTKFARIDPLVCPGQDGRSHLHSLNGNMGISSHSTYKTLRTTGGSNCSPDAAPVCRGGYWWPAMMNGKGQAVREVASLVYYKVIPDTFAECVPIGTSYDFTTDSTKVGHCIAYPNGLRFISGCDMAKLMAGTTPNHCPVDTADPEGNGFVFQCHGSGFRSTGSTNDSISYHSIEAARTSGNPNCTAGHYLYESLAAPQCWDGTHLDSPNHRDHVAFPTTSVALSESGTHWVGAVNLAPAGSGDTISLGSSWAKCPTAFPYLIAGLSVQIGWKMDADFDAGHWHLSCDEQMTMSMAAGACAHFDYWEAWSPTIKNLWVTNCDNYRNSGNFGMLCEGNKIIQGNGGNAGETAPITASVALARKGWSRLISGNQSFHAELKSDANGELGLYAVGGFTGDITVFTVTDRTNVGKHNGATVTTP